MTILEIMLALKNGKRVFCGSRGYEVMLDSNMPLHLAVYFSQNDYYVGLAASELIDCFVETV